MCSSVLPKKDIFVPLNLSCGFLFKTLRFCYMRHLLFIVVLLCGFGLVSAQGEAAGTGNIDYSNWTLKSLENGDEISLSKFAEGKKLVMVVYWAPWCPDWKDNAKLIQKLHEKYSDKGLAVIGVGNYDTLEKMQTHFKEYKFTFPSVYESVSSASRDKTPHFSFRTSVGDDRKWGTPLYVFIEPGESSSQESFAVPRSDIFLDNLNDNAAESFVKKKLGL